MSKLTVSLLVLAGLSLSSPALAHDEIEATSPVAGATVEAGSVPIRLTFGEEPMDLPFGQGNLIAVAKVSNSEQLGPACAKIEGNDLTTNLLLSEPGEYKLLWRVASDDGHVVTGDFNFFVKNDIYFQTDNPGNQCFDENGNELDVKTQELMSKKIEQTDGMWTGLLWGLGIVSLGSATGAYFVKRRRV